MKNGKLARRGAVALATTMILLTVGCPTSGGAGDEPEAPRRGAGERHALQAGPAQRVGGMVDLVTLRAELGLLRGAILQYHRLNGAYPASLDALEQVSRLTYPNEYDYDAASGQVQSRTHPQL